MDFVFNISGDNIAGFVAGVSQNTHNVHFIGNVKVIGVRFLPGAFTNLFGIPASLFKDTLVNLEDIGLPNVFHDLVHDPCSEITDVIKNFDQYFLSLINNYQIDPISEELIYNSRQFDFKHSFLNHFSYKTFNRKMTMFSGMNYKSFQTIVRFQKAISLALNGHSNYADIAYIAGYYDQAHFIHSFKSYTGEPPSVFIEKIKNGNVRFLQYPLGLY